MKRALVLVFCGLATAVVITSQQRQIARLEEQALSGRQITDRMEAALQRMATQQALGEQEVGQRQALTERIAALEAQVHTAKAGTLLAQNVRDDLQRARSELTLLQSQVSTDVERTKQLVDAYISEVRTKEKDAAMRLSETRGAIASLASHLHRDTGLLTRAMLLPTVQLNGDDTVGSGTLVFSGRNEKTGANESYVLTSYHVVRNILADTPRAQKEGFQVTVWLQGEKLDVKGRMVSSQPKIDAALVQLETDRVFPNVANVLPMAAAGDIKVWDPVCAVGCPLGNDPVPTQGEVSSLRNELNGANYWMINAPTYFGNSGGGVYRADTHQLIGVFSKIYTHGKGNPVVIPHMGLCTPIACVYEWLQAEGLEHLLQSQPVSAVDFAQLAAPGK